MQGYNHILLHFMARLLDRGTPDILNIDIFWICILRINYPICVEKKFLEFLPHFASLTNMHIWFI